MPKDEVAPATERLSAAKRMPRATYRLQFNARFTFQDAAGIVEYLHELGVSDVYASPIFLARQGSTHGYDACDFNRFNPALGGEEGFAAFARALQEREMGLLLDVAPNHMGIGDPANRWWTDVLEHGPRSAFAAFFDIDWDPPNPALKNKVLLPVLGGPLGEVLERGELQLGFEAGRFFVRYFEQRFPLSPESCAEVLAAVAADGELTKETPVAVGGIVARLRESAASASREAFTAAKEQTAGLAEDDPSFGVALAGALRGFNGHAGEPGSFERLSALLEAQHYRLAFWRTGVQELNYRRFFDITDLAGVRMERPEVFEASHRLLLRLLSEGKVTGLRIDHPDGLWDPAGYLRRLQAVGRVSPGAPNAGGARGATRPTEFGPLYVVAEKILCPAEELPPDWAVDGTTGYDFLSDVNALFVDVRNAAAFSRIYAEFAGERRSFAEVAGASKRLILDQSLVSEVNSLTRRLKALSEAHRFAREFTEGQLREALWAMLAALPVYRTYVTESSAVAPQEQRFIRSAVADAKRANPHLETVLDFLGATLRLENAADFVGVERGEVARFVMRFQQLSGPVMAKGVEDTAFYVYARLLSLNEVGSNPDRFGCSVAEFHARNAARLQRRPHTLLATATHDTKRGEDARARLSALSELPDEWEHALAHWRTLNADKKRRVNGEPAPDANDEYLLYQTLLGAWPEDASSEPNAGDDFRERIKAYALKAAREAKRRTSWLDPNAAYESALAEFVDALLTRPQANAFLAAFIPLQRKLAVFGRFNSLAQTLLKIASPGVPDFYQGGELWDLNLVDPDNRRPVDFAARLAMLAELRRQLSKTEPLRLAQQLVESGTDERIKLYVSWVGLRFRREHAVLFAQGNYEPVEARGTKAEHVCAFCRSNGNERVLVVVPRLVAGLTTGLPRSPVGGDVWGDTMLWLDRQAASYRDVFTGEVGRMEASSSGGASLALAGVLRSFPVALLELAS